MDVMEKAMRMGEKVSDMEVMESAKRMGENGHARWQVKPLYDATQSGAIAWGTCGIFEVTSESRRPPTKTSRGSPTVFLDR